MGQGNFTSQDRRQIKEQGIDENTVLQQLQTISEGIAPVCLDRACTLGDGIISLSEDRWDSLLAKHGEASASGRMMKFVPASGAATRMFKNLLALHTRKGTITSEKLTDYVEEGDDAAIFGLRFFNNLKRFAFYPYLVEAMEDDGHDLEELLDEGDYSLALKYLLTSKGLDYQNRPKGLIPFHKIDTRIRTPFGEHILEATAYVQDSKRMSRLHFTVAPEHEERVRSHISRFERELSKQGLRLFHKYSIQDVATETIAANPDGTPFRDKDGHLVFRPGGHGALLGNLGALPGEIIYVKNIDNVVPFEKAETTILYKRLLGGLLVELQELVFGFIREIKQDKPDGPRLDEIMTIAEDQLNIHRPSDWATHAVSKKRTYLADKLNRPMRVCGMVKNEGDPGGGPFWVKGKNGAVSLQIVETSQIDKDDPEQASILESATHFNPVDLVCSIKDWKGKPFDLMQYRDPASGFISKKSCQGRELLALELPGLWNGAMADWITVFVETPIETFNPVKTVNDLLKPTHQSIRS